MLKILAPGLVCAVALVAFTSACAPAGDGKGEPSSAADAGRTNPFFTESTLPFHAPPFDRIQDADFMPAFEKGMAEQRAEIDAIASDTAPATFENTLVAMEKSGRLLSRVSMVFNALSSANSDPALQQLQEEIAPKLAAHQDAIYLDPALFARIKTIYDERDSLDLDPESKRLVEHTYTEFVHAGATLSADDKETLKTINKEDAALSAKFTNQLLAGTKAGALVVSDPAELAGLSDAELSAAAAAAKARGLDGQWVLPLQNTTQQPALASLTDRATREELFGASWLRTEHGDANDTRATIARLATLRARKAELLGFPDYAAWKLQDQMAKTPQAVEQFLGKLVPPATANARREAAAIQARIEQQEDDDFALEPWDWQLYAEQVRKAKFDLDESEIKPFFELNRVLEDGVFYAAHELYGLSFEERHDLPVYNSDVRVFEVKDADGSPMALFYCDYFKRDNKLGGAWMDNLVGQSRLLGTKPVVYNVANFTKPAPGQLALLTYDDVSTMFHEFGHALHGLLSDAEYPSLSGTNVARDFVEFPSQINEHWALYPKVLEHYAIDQNGNPMPKELADKIRKAATFNQGYALTEVLAAAELDMQWHTLPADAPEQDVDAFEAQALEKTGLALPQVPPRYRSSYFLHIWANGYAAGYYAYLWAEMLDDDAFAWFEENGGLTRANGDRFRDMVLSRGNTEDLATMYRNFRGRDPEIEPMLENRGLVDMD